VAGSLTPLQRPHSALPPLGRLPATPAKAHSSLAWRALFQRSSTRRTSSGSEKPHGKDTEFWRVAICRQGSPNAGRDEGFVERPSHK